MWRGSLGAAYLFPPLSSGSASIASPCPVSTSRSSNRTCGFPASGSPTNVAFRHTPPTMSRQLHLKAKLVPGSPGLSLEVIGLRHSPIRCSLPKRVRSQAPFLRRQPGIIGTKPVRHPKRPGLSLTGFRLVSHHHRWGFPCCVGPPFIYMPSPVPRREMFASLPFSNGGGLPRLTRFQALQFSRLAQRSSRYGLYSRSRLAMEASETL